jgi:hypothetical protein
VIRSCEILEEEGGVRNADEKQEGVATGIDQWWRVSDSIEEGQTDIDFQSFRSQDLAD